MLIQVILFDGSHDRVESHNLSHMIREGRVKAFLRSSGWALIGIDRIRRCDYVGRAGSVSDLAAEKRSHLQETNPQYLMEHLA